MPMNRHLTWGDRQADVAREKNLKRLQKLAAMAAPKTEEPAAAAKPAQKAKPSAVKTATKPAAKKAGTSKTHASSRKKGKK